MKSISGFTDLVGDQGAFAEEITDTDSVSQYTPYYDKNDKKFKFENGYFFECVTVKSTGYPIVEKTEIEEF